MPTMSSLWPVNVVPSTAATPIVFSSTCGSTSSGPIVYLPGCSGTIRGSTSKYRQNFSQTTCTSPPKTRFGRSVDSPAASRRFRQFHFRDSAPSMIASDEPWVRAPVVSPGAWKRSASMRMQRCSISAVRGYSAWSMKFRCRLRADDPLRLRLHPRRHEGRQVAGRVALEREVLGDQPHRVLGGHPRLRERAGRHLLDQEPVAEQLLVGLEGPVDLGHRGSPAVLWFSAVADRVVGWRWSRVGVNRTHNGSRGGSCRCRPSAGAAPRAGSAGSRCRRTGTTRP